MTNFPYSTTDYTIIKRGKYTTVVSKCNTSFKATFDGNKKASVSIPTEVGPGATGICANCDNDKTNDLRVKNGTDVGDLKKKDMYNEVGNSWWIPTRHETYPE